MKSFVSMVLMAVAVQTASSFVISPYSTPILSNQIVSGPIYAPSCAGPVIAPSSIIASNPCSPIVAPSPIIGPNPCSPTIISPSPIIAANPCAPTTVIRAPQVISTVAPSNSVANSLADTLSLLTVSSLLAETLPLPAVVPVAGLPVSSCGCGSTIYF